MSTISYYFLNYNFKSISFALLARLCIYFDDVASET